MFLSTWQMVFTEDFGNSRLADDFGNKLDVL